MPRIDPDMSSLERGHEPLQTRVKGVVAAAVGIVILLAVTLAGLVLLLNWFAQREREQDSPPSPLAGQRQPPPDPRLQTAPGIDMAQYQREQQDRLTTYGWVDRDQSLAHEPIERTIQRVAAQGLAPRSDAEGKP